MILFYLFLMLFSFQITAGPVTEHGRLYVDGPYLKDEKGEPLQLKGMSSHGLQWFGHYANIGSMRELRDKWGQTVFRAAMYTAEGGYLQNPKVKDKVHEIVRAAIDLDIYVIIDWHILSDRNPMWNVEASKKFFDEMSKTYADYPNVIYEIANEPNGDAGWYNAIRPYAERVVPVIRANDPDGIVIVGTASWSQNVRDPANYPLPYSNIMYAAHFYAGTHGQWMRDNISYAMSKGIAIFVSEWGSMDASGRGPVNYNETRNWMNFLRGKKISWAGWSLSDSYDTHAVLRHGAGVSGGWKDFDLTANGLLLRGYMLQD